MREHDRIEAYANADDVSPPPPRGVVASWATGLAAGLVGLTIGLVLATPGSPDWLDAAYAAAIALTVLGTVPLFRLVDQRGTSIYGCTSEATDLTVAIRQGDLGRIRDGIDELEVKPNELPIADDEAGPLADESRSEHIDLVAVALRRVLSLEDLLARAGAYAEAADVAELRRTAQYGWSGSEEATP
jgi:hypothetical protein